MKQSRENAFIRILTTLICIFFQAEQLTEFVRYQSHLSKYEKVKKNLMKQSRENDHKLLIWRQKGQ